MPYNYDPHPIPCTLYPISSLPCCPDIILGAGAAGDAGDAGAAGAAGAAGTAGAAGPGVAAAAAGAARAALAALRPAADLAGRRPPVLPAAAAAAAAAAAVVLSERASSAPLRTVGFLSRSKNPRVDNFGGLPLRVQNFTPLKEGSARVELPNFLVVLCT